MKKKKYSLQDGKANQKIRERLAKCRHLFYAEIVLGVEGRDGRAGLWVTKDNIIGFSRACRVYDFYGRL